MKRSTFITWDQLKVGSMILVAIAILCLAIFKLGEAANLFTKRYQLVAFMPNAVGLLEGSSVTVAGQLAGVVKSIEFQKPSFDTLRTLKVTLAVNENLQPLIRENSYAQLRTLGLLGDKVLDITTGTPDHPILRPNDTLRVKESLDYEQVIAQASGAVGDMVELTHDLRAITSGIVRGEGTMGQLLTSRTLYDELTATLTQTDALLRRLQQPNGTLGRMLDDPTLYNNLSSVTLKMDSLLGQLSSNQGTLGRLMGDTVLYTRMVTVVAGADSLMKLVTSGNGTASRLLNDPGLYDKLNKSVTDLNAILEDIRKNPRKYMKGVVTVF